MRRFFGAKVCTERWFLWAAVGTSSVYTFMTIMDVIS